jgi:hypothetical protein
MPKKSAWIAFRIGSSGTQTIENQILLIHFCIAERLAPDRTK